MADTKQSGQTILDEFRAAMQANRAAQQRAIAVPSRRMYAAARSNRLTGGFGSAGNSSADAELASSLTSLRARSRQMVRDSAYAKRAKVIVVNNVVGAGIGMQAQVTTSRGELSQRVNDGIERSWVEWACADACHTGGAMHFHDLERAAMGQVFEAGEIFIRMHHSRFGNSRVPLALELIEPERLAHELVDPGAVATDAEVRMGVEVDAFGRALAYWVRRRHPGDIRGRIEAVDRFERVPASDMFHLRIVDRWPQTRGEPWLHTVLRKLDDMNEYSSSEVQAARASAYYFATVKKPSVDSGPIGNDQDESEQPLIDIEPLTVQELAPGEELEFHSPNRPNTALDPFMRYMLREVSAGCGPSYESLSRDYSQSNYSSSRLALLDDRDLWRTLQQWWIRSFRQPLHARWLHQAVLARAIDAVSPSQYATDMRKFEAVLFKPRGWNWVDPTKEVAAYKEAVKAGFITVTDVIAATAGGQDIEDVIATRKRELELMEEAGIKVDTTVSAAPAKPPPAAAPPPDGGGDDDNDDDQSDDPPRRVISFPR